MLTLESNWLEERLDKIIKEFAQAIAECPEFLAFEKAQKKLEEAQKAQSLIKEYGDKQQLFHMFGNSSDSQAQAELNKYREKMLACPQIRDYFQKQDDLTRFFQELGKFISDVVGFDFGRACAPPTGCC